MFPRRKQSGSVLIIAVFVIVVMGMLGLTLTRLEWSNQDTLTREVLGTQAWFLAHSGNEWGLTYLFPLNPSGAGDTALTRCNNLGGTAAQSAAVSLLGATENRCHTLQIDCTTIDGGQDLTFFKVTSTATCGQVNGEFEVQREQEVWARGIE